MSKIYAVLAVMAVVLVFGGLGVWLYKIWTLGNNSDDYEIVCIVNHEYYVANLAHKAMASIRLDDNGKPIKCEPRR